MYLMGEDEASIKAWLVNRSGSIEPAFTTETAPLFWIGEALIPTSYPKSTSELRAFLGDHAARVMLDDIVVGRPDQIVSVLGFATANGPALAGVLLSAPQAARHGAREPLTKGFRAGAVPQSTLTSRYYGGATLARATVMRADPTWIHGRGQDLRAMDLRRATVVMIGCGSIGAPVALLLAQAGIGRLILIDPDILSWANVGRHPLGASYVGTLKAKGLAEKLRADLPHMTVDYHATDLDAILRKSPEILSGASLIIAATGSWAAESQLDAWHAATGRRVPILYAWTEAHACAGHAVLIREDGALQHGFDATGMPNLRVTAWPKASTQRQEPACGAVYQPYGPVELGFISALIADLALDAVLMNRRTSVHRIWATSRERLLRLGGDWSADWRMVAGVNPQGSQIVELSWPPVLSVQPAVAVAA